MLPYSHLRGLPAFTLDLERGEELVGAIAAIQLRRNENVIVLRAEDLKASSEQRAELKALSHVLHTVHGVKTSNSHEGDVAHAPQAVQAGAAVCRILLELWKIRVL